MCMVACNALPFHPGRMLSRFPGPGWSNSLRWMEVITVHQSKNALGLVSFKTGKQRWLSICNKRGQTRTLTRLYSPTLLALQQFFLLLALTWFLAGLFLLPFPLVFPPPFPALCLYFCMLCLWFAPSLSLRPHAMNTTFCIPNAKPSHTETTFTALFIHSNFCCTAWNQI